MWRRKPNENAPAVIVVYLVMAALMGLVLWKMPAKTAAMEWIFILPMAGLLLPAARELVWYVLLKKRQQKADTAETEPNVQEETETEEMRKMRQTVIVAAVFSIFWIIKGVLDLRRGWVNTLVYDGLFLLVGALVVVWAFKQYQAARNTWKEE